MAPITNDEDLKLLYLLHKKTGSSAAPRTQDMAAAMNLKAPA